MATSKSEMPQEASKQQQQQLEGQNERRNLKSLASNPKYHFKIEWRQLSYHHTTDSIKSRAARWSSVFARRRAADESELSASELESMANSSFCSSSFSTSSQFDSLELPAVGDCRRRPRNTRRLLDSLDGSFSSGQLSAILGPSGAGKTTFLSTLFGSKQDRAYGQTRVTWFHDSKHRRPIRVATPTSGRNSAASSAGQHQQQPLGVESADIVSGAQTMRKRPLKIAFLPQRDHLLNHLTVHETLMFASRIKNSDEFVRRQQHQLRGADQSIESFHRRNVRRVAKMLQLTDCFETRCSKLSGGQYKRVSIGQELLSRPDVIILDEPTSGLDAMTCLATIRTLKSIVMRRRHPISIILTIHQPDQDAFNLFDHIYVIAQGGMAIYEGPPSGIVGTLAKVGLLMPRPDYNPARLIVENAFIDCPGGQEQQTLEVELEKARCGQSSLASSCSSSASSSSDEEEEDDEDEDKPTSTFKRSFLSLTGSILNPKEEPAVAEQRRRQSKRPLLSIGIQTADGKLITRASASAGHVDEAERKQRLQRLQRLRALNKMQRTPYAADSWDKQAADYCCCSCDNNSTAGVSPDAASCYHSTSSLADQQQQQQCDQSDAGASEQQYGRKWKPKRNFDKSLSAKLCNSSAGQLERRQRWSNWWRHTRLLAHRTWLSIVRDPVFFGIQLAMHTTIPILLALIFGSDQNEACPRLHQFDLVQFAYQSDAEQTFIRDTMRSIRQSIGNTGTMFFEMFVLCFAINCITALVFPLDMSVLLKEYRNGWYSLGSYFAARTLADLPVPLVLHSMAVAILYYLTNQPAQLWRFGSVLGVVLLASLSAQSCGLTIGAILMRSSQSAVLAAAGIVAPFFALSGFIVRIHSLPLAARVMANFSYLYHMLNGFIILRYGFGRCQCQPDELQPEPAHEIPHNLRTLASIWIGSYSNEYPNSAAALQQPTNRTNVDPNIDLVDKMLSAFKMINSFGHKIDSCADVLPYAMLDFNLRDSDIVWCVVSLLLMLVVSRLLTFAAIYMKISSAL